MELARTSHGQDAALARITWQPSELDQRADDYEEALCAEVEARVAEVLARAFARADRALTRSLVTPGQRRRRAPLEASVAINEARRSLREVLQEDQQKAGRSRARADRSRRPVGTPLQEPKVIPVTLGAPPMSAPEPHLVPVPGIGG